ncbi:Hypothetical predicted protein [Octopus vulgaris]|uniref:Uncharacterized protein n=1 Tax=Octopus vulgaris TaxID=6645 RepID=A0AA36BZX7_OCTVU|nr:Hypothetical predicted protein [Octopus vulgaris]
MLHRALADCKIGIKAAFKSTWATKAFDSSEDYKRVIKDLVPPKGVKRANNIERLRIFDCDGIEEKAAESDSEDEREPSGNLLEVSEPSGEIPMEVSQDPKHGRPNMMTGGSVSLVVNSDDQVSNDALFLEKRQELDENETSTLLLPYQRKLMSTVSEARRSVKKRVPKRRNLQKDSDEKS